MYNFSKYNKIIEKLIRVDDDVAYWQPSESGDISIGMKIESGDITKFKDIENIFESSRPKEYPSRINSIRIATTKDNITFDTTLPVYEVNITGTIFYGDLRKFNEAVHSEDTEQLYSWVKKYWESSPINKENYTELILNGEATIIGIVE